MKNGELLSAAEEAGFDISLTAAKNIRYQQNLTERKIAIVVLSQLRWRLVRKRLPEIVAAVNAAGIGSLAEVDIPFE